LPAVSLDACVHGHIARPDLAHQLTAVLVAL
jgi:hypothetical protein